MYIHIDWSTFFIIHHWACYWISSQVVNVVMVGPVQLFPFLWFSGGCVFSSSVALCCGPLFSRTISPCLNL